MRTARSCGIYDDAREFEALRQQVDTIERSVRGIAESETAHDIARWTMNKEDHAERIMDSAECYFLAQRVRITAVTDDGYEDYVGSLSHLHAIIVHAMQAKQSADAVTVDRLRDAIEGYRDHYFEMHGHEHSAVPE